jgi:DNA-binding GntR family transcriptional regulator
MTDPEPFITCAIIVHEAPMARQVNEIGDGAIFRQLEAVSLTEGVVAALKDAFFSGTLKPGAVIVERQIAKQMNVGTPVVREALISLKH